MQYTLCHFPVVPFAILQLCHFAIIPMCQLCHLAIVPFSNYANVPMCNCANIQCAIVRCRPLPKKAAFPGKDSIAFISLCHQYSVDGIMRLPFKQP